jgi:hypothetical protein
MGASPQPLPVQLVPSAGAGGQAPDPANASVSGAALAGPHGAPACGTLPRPEDAPPRPEGTRPGPGVALTPEATLSGA